MPLRLSVGVTRKLGLPSYSSIGASCSLDLELDSGVLHDLAGFHAQARDAFVAARQAVNDELARLRDQATVGEIHRAAASNGQGQGHVGGGAQAVNGGRAPGPEARAVRTGKAATAGQVRAIVTIA